MPTMTMDPTDPIQGGTAKLCYVDPPTGGVDVEIIWTPSSLGTQTCNLTPAEPCCTIQIPGTAEQYQCEDQSGEATDIGGAVQAS